MKSSWSTTNNSSKVLTVPLASFLLESVVDKTRAIADGTTSRPEVTCLLSGQVSALDLLLWVPILNDSNVDKPGFFHLTPRMRARVIVQAERFRTLGEAPLLWLIHELIVTFRVVQNAVQFVTLRRAAGPEQLELPIEEAVPISHSHDEKGTSKDRRRLGCAGVLNVYWLLFLRMEAV